MQSKRNIIFTKWILWTTEVNANRAINEKKNEKIKGEKHRNTGTMENSRHDTMYKNEKKTLDPHLERKETKTVIVEIRKKTEQHENQGEEDAHYKDCVSAGRNIS